VAVLQQRDYISCGFDNTDLVIAIGYDLLNIPESGTWWRFRYSYWITPAEIDSSYSNGWSSGGYFRFPQWNIETIRPTGQASYALELRADIQADYEQYAKDDAFPIKPQLIYDLRQVMGPEDIVISDVGRTKCGLRGIITRSPQYLPDFQWLAAMAQFPVL